MKLTAWFISTRIFFESNGSLEGLKCHEIALYFLMKPRGTQELNSNSYTQGVRETMHWFPIGELDKYKAYPTFLKEKIGTIGNGIEHIVTHEINTDSGSEVKSEVKG